MKYFDGNFLIYDSVTKFKASHITEEAMEGQGGKHEIVLRQHNDVDLTLPYVEDKPLHSSDSINLKNWFRDMIRNSDKIEMAKQGIRGILNQHNVNFIEEDVEAIVHIPLDAKASKKTTVGKELLEYASGNAEAMRALRLRIIADDVKYPNPNERKNQLEPTDQVGLELPRATEIIEHTLGEDYQKTEYTDTCSPYPNQLYRLRNVLNILMTREPKERLEQIKTAINVLINDHEKEITEMERRALESRFEVIPLEHVIGNPDNDNLPIQENEQKFYENIQEFMRYHILRFNREVMKNSTAEEIEAKSEQDYKKGLLPLRVIEFFEQVLEDTLKANFYHTGNFNIQVGDFDDDGDDLSNSTDSSNDGDNDKAGLIISKADKTKSDLHYIAASYLGTSAETFGADAWAEGIIKTMRWGERKIKNLSVGKNNTQYLDLQRMDLITQEIADLSEFNVIEEDGKTLEVMLATYVDFVSSNDTTAHSYPFLLMGQEYGTLPGSDEEIPVTYMVTLFDIVRSYEQGKGQVIELEFKDGKFVSNYAREDLQEIVMDEVKLAKRNVKLIDELFDYAIDNGVAKMEGTAFSILHKSEFEREKSTEVILEELVNTPKSLRTPLIQSRLIGIFSEGGKDYDGLNLDELLNWYYVNVYPTHKSLYEKVFGLANIEGNKTLNARNVPTANFFGQGEITEQPEVEVEEEGEQPFMYAKYEISKEELAQLNFNKITQKKDGQGPVLGGYIERDGHFIFAANDEISNFDINGTSLDIAKVLLKMFEVTLAADPANTDYTNKYRVISDRTIVKIHRALYGK